MINAVTVNVMADTTICATDPVQLRAVTDGLRFNWQPAVSLNNPSILSPIARPVATTTYILTATVGGCTATDDVIVNVVPYPAANAGPDTTICYSTSAQFHATISGSSFTWTPASTLNNPAALNPVATPLNTTAYILSVTDNLGCPKAGKDTLLVTVLPRVNAYAGKDTSVVVGQPLIFNASGGSSYLWSPPTSLSKNDISNPTAIYDGSFDSIRYFVLVRNESGCSDLAQVAVRIFKTNPQIFVPSAFTPNGDGVNDVFRPIPVGITKINYFRVYNRWGQLVYASSSAEEGWNGKVGGVLQPTATYVWIVRGEDFTGKVVFAKGVMTLIR